ncbi:hypothetical protein DW228_06245 [Bacteroides fragilis]|mgnify:CR=1 FL=1|uniref:Transmembrane protein n=1 Tax=Bacteroides fragilis TaxID=817 RepID=A0A396C4M3_BACFG|nr:hypothetical protein DW228_06245 [Bacteroides fragilis]
MSNQKINRITFLNYFRQRVQENSAVLIKLHDIVLYVIEMLFLATCTIGVIAHIPYMSLVGILGVIGYMPLWCYVASILYDIENK